MRLALVAIAGVILPLLCHQVSPGRDLHMDETLYLGWADHWAVTTDWWLEHPTYAFIKPPLYPLLLGAVIWVFGDHRWVFLLPNLAFSVATLYASFRLAVALSGALAGWFTLVLMATSAFWNFYAYSCFTDPGLALSTLVSVLYAARGQWRRAGAAAAVAIGMKQFGLAAMALVLGLALLEWRPARAGPPRWRRGMDVLLGAGPILTLLLLWEICGHHHFHAWLHGSPVPLGITFMDSHVTFLAWVRELAAETCLGGTGLLLACGAAFSPAPRKPSPAPLIVFLAGYLALLSCSTIPVWARYNVWIFPLFAIAAACGLVRVGDWVTRLRPSLQGIAPATVLGVVLLLGARALEAKPEPIEMIRFGLLDVLRREWPALSPPAHVLIPIDVRWEVTGMLQQEKKFISLETYAGRTRVIEDAVANNRHRDVYVLGVDPRVLNVKWAHTFAAWNALARRPPWRSYRSTLQDYHYEIVKISKTTVLAPCAVVPLTMAPNTDWAFGARLRGLAVRRHGAALRLTTSWTAFRPITSDWMLFLEILDNDQHRLAYQEYEPVGGTHPTSRWKPGSMVADCTDLDPHVTEKVLKAAATIRIGFYNPFIQQRAVRSPSGAEHFTRDWRGVFHE